MDDVAKQSEGKQDSQGTLEDVEKLRARVSELENQLIANAQRDWTCAYCELQFATPESCKDHVRTCEKNPLVQQKDGAYSERNQVLALLARMALALGWKVGIGQHPMEDANWEKDWRTILFIELPTGQCSWHFRDSEVHLLSGLPFYAGKWDGHTTEEKYDRVNSALRGGTAPQVTMPAAPKASKVVDPWKGPWLRPFGYSPEDWAKLDEEDRGLVWFMRMQGGVVCMSDRRTLADVDLELRQYVAQQVEKLKGFVHFGPHISRTACDRQISDFPGLDVERSNWARVTCLECKAR